MIKLPAAGLSAAERFALDLLVDLGRLVPAASTLDVVRLELSAQAPRELRGWMAAGWGIDVADGVVRVPRSVLQAVVDVAGAAAEQRATERDRYSRVPSSANPLVREGLEREPVIQRAALALQAATRNAAGRRAFRTVAPWPDARRWAAAFTHDLDVVSWWPAFTLLRIAELARKGSLALSTNALGPEQGPESLTSYRRAGARDYSTLHAPGRRREGRIMTGSRQLKVGLFEAHGLQPVGLAPHPSPCSADS